ncbi:MAG: hypothetical protein RBS56_03955 [Candidatus Gracilibacteria bacterium]|jgi:hypothetical protein|nr:hypothetical protein [Candidatus Gracilibacteria bacterium]
MFEKRFLYYADDYAYYKLKETRLIYNTNVPSNPGQSPSLSQLPDDFEAQNKRSMVLHDTQIGLSTVLSQEEKDKIDSINKAKDEISTFDNSYGYENDPVKIEEFEVESKKSEDEFSPMTLSKLKEETNPDYKNWNYTNNEGLSKILVELRAMKINTDSPFYKSLFSILYNANAYITDGDFPAGVEARIFADPIKYEAEIGQIVDKDKNFNGKLYIASIKHIIAIQQMFLKVDVDTFVSEEASWGDKAGDKLNGVVGDIGKDFKKALKEKNLPKLLMYGFGGFLAYKAGQEIWDTKGGKGGLYIGGLAALVYLTGNGKAFEKYLNTQGITPDKAIDQIMDYSGDGGALKGFLESIGANRENLEDILGSVPNSVDNLEYIVNQSSSPASIEVKRRGIDEETLTKLKDTNLADLIELKKMSDQTDPMAKFIPPNHEVLKGIFPEYRFVKNPVFRKETELAEIKKQSGILETGGIDSSFTNYVDMGKMIFNIVAAMQIGYDDIVKPNDNKYSRMSFDEAMKSPECEGMKVRHFLHALREYTIKDFKEAVESFFAFSDKALGDKKDDFDLKINSQNRKTGIYNVTVFGMPMRAFKDTATSQIILYLTEDLPDGEPVNENHKVFLVLPDELKDGVFEQKFSEIVMKDKEKIETTIPSKTVEIMGKKYEKKDMEIGDFKRVSGVWVINVVSKSEKANGNEVILYVGEVNFDAKGKPVVKFSERTDFKDKKTRYEAKISAEAVLDNSSFVHIKEIFTNRNLMDASFTDPLEFEPVKLTTDGDFEFKLNGLSLKAIYDKDKNTYEVYSLNDNLFKFEAPSDFKNGLLVDTFVKPHEAEILKGGKITFNGKEYQDSDKTIDNIYWDSGKKAFVARIVSKDDQKIHLQDAIIKFDENNNPQLEFNIATQVKLEEVAKQQSIADQVDQLNEVNETLKTISRPFSGGIGNLDGYKSPDNYEISPDGKEITIKTFGHSFILYKEDENQWNFKESKLYAYKGYTLQQAIIMADFANKVFEARKGVSKEIPIFFLEGEFVFGIKTSWTQTKAKTFLPKNEVALMRKFFPNKDYIGWTNNVIKRVGDLFS